MNNCGVHCYGRVINMSGVWTEKAILIVMALPSIWLLEKLSNWSNNIGKMLNKMGCNNTIKAELALNTSEFRILCQTRWIVRAGSFQGTFDDWLLVLQLMEKNYADIAGIVLVVQIWMTQLLYTVVSTSYLNHVLCDTAALAIDSVGKL